MTTPIYMSILAYGYAGSGKTSFGVSSFVEKPWYPKEAKQIRRGKWVTFGRESNPALWVPENSHIALVSPLQDSTKFADDLTRFGEQVYKENLRAITAGTTVPVEAIVLDGLSEFDLMFEQIQRKQTDNKFQPWNELLTKMFEILQLLDPPTLRCHVIVTARVTEKRLGLKDAATGNVVNKDPDFISALHPSVRGQMRDSLPHYFNCVFYFDQTTETVEVGGKKDRMRVHRINLVPDENVLVKNVWEAAWQKEGKPKRLINASFDDVLTIIQSLQGDK